MTQNSIVFQLWYELNLLSQTIQIEFPLNFRGGISVVTESGDETKSHLVIRNARQSDEGNYTCKPSIFRSASLRLFVIDGKEPGARSQETAPSSFCLMPGVSGELPAAMHTSTAQHLPGNLRQLIFSVLPPAILWILLFSSQGYNICVLY